MIAQPVEAAMGKLDDMGKGAWIGLMVLGFILFWPMGLGMLAFLIMSGRMGSKRCRRGGGRWRFERDSGDSENASHRRYESGSPSSGNGAFDEYRTETLKRLEQEQAEFMEFLERLRFAKDKEEFDQFLASRRQALAPDPETPDAPPAPA